MAFTTKSTLALLTAGQIVQNVSGDPSSVEAHSNGVPVGVVLDAETITAGMDDPTVIGYSARVIYGGGDHAVQVTPPAGYTGEIARFDVTQNSVIVIVSTGGHGSLVGINPTWMTWG